MPIHASRGLRGACLAAFLLVAGCGGSSSSAPLAFTLVLGAPVPIESGGTGTLEVQVERASGHVAPIALSVVANGEGITGSGTLAGGASQGSLTLLVPGSAAVGAHALQLSASDGGVTRTASFDLPVVAPLAIAVGSHLASGVVGVPYALAFGATGGTPPHAFDVVAGTLPDGLVLGPDGALSGTPTGAGTSAFTLRASDAFGLATTRLLSHTICATLLPALGLNGSFEQGFAGWTSLGQGAGAVFALVPDPIEGSTAARVTNRTSASHGPWQDVYSATLAGAAGTPLTTRFWIKVDAPAMARCVLTLTSDLGVGPPFNTKLILAERVVRVADAWTEVAGTVTLAWDGTLSAAGLSFEVAQPVEGVFPGFTLDDLRIERDADGDGLPDPDEVGAQANDPDRDHDGLPDGWELAHAVAGLLGPDQSDAGLDADADGYSNREEYWAATDPGSAGSRPGVPSVSGASAGVIALTEALALLPSRNEQRVLAGQHITGQTTLGGLAGEYASNVQALFDQTGKWPALLSLQYEAADPAHGELQIDLVNPVAEDWAANGGLVLIKFQPFDPWTFAPSSPSGGAHVDLPGLLDPLAGNPANLAANTAANAVWLDWLDRMATGLDELQQAGVVVLWRPLSEMNNAAHWQSRQPRDAWIALWRHMHAYFSVERGLKNLIWVFESDSVAHPVVPADYYYPGDDVVDLMGHNLYDDDWVLAQDLDALFRRYPKIYGFPQAGSSSVRDGTWDDRTMILGIRESFPRASLFCAWNDFYTSGNVFNARSLVSQSFATELLDDPWVVTRDEVGW